MSLPTGIKIQIEVDPLGGERTRLSIYAVQGTARALLASKDYEVPEKAWRKVASVAREAMIDIGLERKVVSDAREVQGVVGVEPVGVGPRDAAT